MEESDRVQEEGSKEGIQPVVRKRIRNRPYALFVSFIVIALIIITVLFWNSLPPHRSGYAGFYTVKGSTATAITWTVISITSGLPLPTSMVYVQIKNATGFVTTPTLLADANGHHGFTYMSGGGSPYFSVGDLFSLSKDYTQGSEIYLVNEAGSDRYAILTR